MRILLQLREEEKRTEKMGEREEKPERMRRGTFDKKSQFTANAKSHTKPTLGFFVVIYLIVFA